jgi:exopolysaccharide biosynthesis polyprenyl glycosylphosphotransferase
LFVFADFSMKLRSGVYFWHPRRRGLIAIDFLLSGAAILIAYAIYPTFTFTWNSLTPTQPSPIQAGLIFPWFVLLTMHVAGLHDPLGDRRLWLAVLRIAAAVGAALGFCLLVFYIAFFQQIGRTILLCTFVFSFVLLGGVRFLLWQLAVATPRKIGCHMPPGDESILRGMITKNNLRMDLFVADERSRQCGAETVADWFDQSGVAEVVVVSHAAQQEVWIACLNRGIQVTDLVVFVEREFYKVPCDIISISWFLQFDPKWNHPYYFRVKRVSDVMIALIGIALSIPVGVLAGLAIILESGSPVFYSQLRVGFRGRPYRIWKLRTMRNDAEKGGARWASSGDSRVTAVGRFLRRTRIDELPQFWNVLRGEMSVIGPRPERPEFVEQLAKEIPMYPQRHWIKPGITGWAQINYPYGASIQDAREKLCYDLYYLKNASLLVDVHIALRTLGVVMKGSR